MIYEANDTLKMGKCIIKDFYIDKKTKLMATLEDECRKEKTNYQVEKVCRYWHLQKMLHISLDIEKVDFKEICMYLNIGSKKT